MIKTLDDKHVTDKRVCVVGYIYLKNYTDCYSTHHGLSDFEIAKIYNKHEKNPKTTIDDVDLEQHEDREILLKPLVLVFQGKKNKGKQRKRFFYTNVKDVYSIENLTNLLFRIAKCKKISDADRHEIRKNVCWYLEIRKTIMEAVKTLPFV